MARCNTCLMNDCCGADPVMNAAEDMLEALKNLEIEGGCFCGKHGNMSDDLHAMYCRKARAAIAKAEGRES